MAKYNPPRSEFHKFCDYPKCGETVVRCTAVLEDGNICGCLGHPDYYKKDEDHVVFVVKHAHFLTNKDTGRNVFHMIALATAPMSIRVNTWRVYREPDRWKKIPIEVRKNLGWD